MSWPSKPVPKYRKHRASGQAIVSITGKDHYLGPHGTKASHALYDRLVAEFLSAFRQVVEPARAESISVVEVLAAFWRHCKNYYVKDGKPTNKQDAFRIIIRHVRNLSTDVRAQKFAGFRDLISCEPAMKSPASSLACCRS